MMSDFLQQPSPIPLLAESQPHGRSFSSSSMPQARLVYPYHHIPVSQVPERHTRLL